MGLQRRKKKLSYCVRTVDENSGMELFNLPEIRRINIMPVSGEMILLSGGQLTTRYLVAKLKINLFQFKEGDRVYVNIAPPPVHDTLCEKADYFVKSASEGHNIVEVLFEKRA